MEAFTNAYNKQAVGPAKSEVFMEFMRTAIPKISKDVLTKEYKKQKENEASLNGAIKVLQEKNKMLEENLHEIENEHGIKQDELEDLQIKLKKATQQEQYFLNKAEEEADKRQDLMNALESEKEKNIKLEQKRKNAEKELRSKAKEFEIESRDLQRKLATGAKLTKEEEERLAEEYGGNVKKPRGGDGVHLSELEVEEKSDQGSTYRNGADSGRKKNKRKRVGNTKSGESNCKCIIF